MSRYDPRDLRAIEREQRDREAREQLSRDQYADDLKWLMRHAEGRRFMARLIERTGMSQTSFTGNSTTFFNEGARSIGIFLTDEIKAIALDDYIAMLKEQRK